MKNFLLSAVAIAGFAVAGTAQACPNWSLTPNYGEASFHASQLRSPQAFRLTAGGDNHIGACPMNYGSDRPTGGQSFFTSAPDARFFISGLEGNRLAISVQGYGCDTALLINTQSVTWYYDDDDGGNLNPRITLTHPLSGQIDVWVGTYDGSYCDADLILQVY